MRSPDLQHHLRVPVRASILFTLSCAITKAASFFFTPIFTRLLRAEEYGGFALYNTWVGTLGALLTFGFGGGILYRGLQKYAARADGFLSGAMTLCGIPLALGGIALAVFAKPIAHLTGLPVAWLPFLYMQLLGDAILTLVGTQAKYRYRPLVPVLTRLILALSPILSVLLILKTPLRTEARILVSALTTACIGAVAAVALYRRGRTLYDRVGWQFLLRHGARLIPHHLAVVAIADTSRLLVGRMHGTEDLASYTIAQTVAAAPALLTVGINAALQPWLLRKAAAGEWESITKTATRVLLLVALCISALFPICPEVFGYLAPDRYRAAVPLVVPLALSTLPLFVYSVFSSLSFYREASGRIARASLAAGVVHLVAAFALIPRLGMAAAAYISPISNSLLALFHYLSHSDIRRKTFEIVKNCFLYMCFSVLVGRLSFLCYAYFALRLLLSFSILLCVLLLLNKSKGLLQEQKSFAIG